MKLKSLAALMMAGVMVLGSLRLQQYNTRYFRF